MLGIKTYRFNTKSFLRSSILLLLVCFVIFKPIRAIAIDFSEDKIEYSCGDSDSNESDENESDDKETEKEDTDKEDHVPLSFLAEDFNSVQKNFSPLKSYCLSDFHLGVALPPPEFI